MPHSEAKKQKLTHLQAFKSKLPHHSQSALQAILQEVEDQGLPELHSSEHQREARQQLLADCHGGSLGPLIQTAQVETNAGAMVPFAFTSLLVYLASLYSRGGSFQKLLQSKHHATPSSPLSPWSLVLYLDELVPGNVLGRAERKSWAFYATFLQFGDHLANQDAWLTICLARSHFVSNLKGGPSQIMAMLLKSIFANAIVNPSHGFLLKHPSGDIRLHFKWDMLLADGAAQKLAWASKGDSGSKFCMLCANIRAAGTNPENQHNSTTKYQQLVLTTDSEVLESYQRLHDRVSTCSKKEFACWEQATGWTYNSKALLLDSQLLALDVLKPVSQFCHDYMHGVLQGTGPIVLFNFLLALENHMTIWPCLEEYFSFFQFPKGWKCQHVASYFGKKKAQAHKSNAKISCQASGLLAIFPIVRHFVYAVIQPRGLCPAECNAFLTMAAAIDQLHDGNLAKAITRASLLQAMEASIAAFTAAFPEVPMIKKWHWMLHLPDHFAKWQILPNCFASERKHKPIGQLASLLTNQNHFEHHLLDQVVAKEISCLDQPDLFPEGVYLVKARPASKKVLLHLNSLLETKVDQAKCSHVAKVRGATCSRNDAVLFFVGDHVHPPWQVGEIQLHFDFQGHTSTLVQAWDIQSYLPQQQYCKCSRTSNLGFIRTQDILTPVVHSKSQQEAKVLLPYHIYSKG